MKQLIIGILALLIVGLITAVSPQNTVTHALPLPHTQGPTACLYQNHLPFMPQTDTTSQQITPQINVMPQLTYNGPITNVGTISFQELKTGHLNWHQTHSWNINLEAATTLTVMVATENNSDIIISLIDPQGMLLTEQNKTGQGEVERITSFPIAATGAHQIHVRTANACPAAYFIMSLSNTSYNFSFEDIITYGETPTNTLQTQNDHFWIFTGSTDDIICITAAPNTNTDLFLELYGPDASRISAFIDNGDSGQAEELEFALIDSGLHAIRIGEFNFAEASYALTLNLSPCG